jgi:hypothetical protein
MSRACCKTFAFIFLGIIFVVPLFQGVWEKAVEGESLRVLGVFRKVPSEANLRSFEKELEESCKVADWLRPAYRQLRWLLMRDLGDKAVAAADGWAYYGPNIRYLGEGYFKNVKSENPGEDPTATIADFAAQLRRRGIALLVVPVPSKPAIAPERLRHGLAPSLDLSVHTRRFMDELRGRGIDVVRSLHAAWCASSRSGPTGRGCISLRTRTGQATARASWRRCWPSACAPWWARTSSCPAQLPSRSGDRARRPDIPRMSRLPGEATGVSRPSTTAYRVLDEEGEPYADSDERRFFYSATVSRASTRPTSRRRPASSPTSPTSCTRRWRPS